MPHSWLNLRLLFNPRLKPVPSVGRALAVIQFTDYVRLTRMYSRSLFCGTRRPQVVIPSIIQV